MALKTIRFAFKAEPDLSLAIQRLKHIETIVCDSIAGQDYGSGVQAIYIGIILVEAEHARKFATKRPVYRAGKYELREGGLSMWFEDTLEFDIIPRLEDVRRAASMEELAQALREAFQSRHLSLQITKILNFDRMRFLSDLDKTLTRIASLRSSNGLLAPIREVGLDQNAEQFGAPNASTANHQASVRSFAQDVMAFVERELPNVKLAVREKRRELLKPVIARSQEFLDRWRLTDPSAVDTCPACACLIADIVREAAVELDDVSIEERQRVHEEFQKELQICKMILM
jgi:hypothetical protein